MEANALETWGPVLPALYLRRKNDTTARVPANEVPTSSRIARTAGRVG
jgi:hypothetical protein